MKTTGITLPLKKQRKYNTGAVPAGFVVAVYAVARVRVVLHRTL